MISQKEEIRKAIDFSTKAHSSQTYDEFPYFKHLQDVHDVLVRFGLKEENPDDLPILVSSYIHDTIEDTATSYSDLRNIFGTEVAEIVYCVTDELGRNRKEKKEKTYPKIRQNPKAIIVKLADRIANIEHSSQMKNTNFMSMYKKEWNDFVLNLRLYKHADDMWNHLEKLINEY